MKTIDRSKRRWLLGAVTVLGLAIACSEDKGGTSTDPGSSQPISVQDIIASPKSAGPGDTLQLSAIVVSSDENVGDIPTVAWTATGGAFLEDDEASVRWVAPVGGVYTVTAKAKNSANTATGTSDLFVGGEAVVVNSQAGAIRLQANQTDFYFLHSGNNVSFGVEAFAVLAGLAGDAVDLPASVDGPNNTWLTYAPNVSFEVHSVDSIMPGATDNPIHLYIGDFGTKTYRSITLDTPAGTRHQGYLYPDVATDNRLVAFEGFLPQALASGADSFDIFVYDAVASTRQRVTLNHGNHRNAFPTWSTDQRWLTFVSDRSGARQWDLYGMPIVGGVINTAQASLVRLSNTGGVLAAGTMAVDGFAKPLMAWNPVAPILAVLASDGVTYLIETTATASNQITVGTFASGVPSEFAWSPDGTWVALTTGGEILTVANDGSRTSRLARAGDTFADLAWSPDSGWLVYRATRGSSAWLEVIDLDQSTLSDPIAISAAAPIASATTGLATYRALMSMSPVWGGDVLYVPTFGTGLATPGIMSVDVSGLTP